MKTSIVILALLATSSVGLVPVAAKVTATPPAPAMPAVSLPVTALQVAVNVPPSMRPWRDDDVADAFADRLTTALRSQGFKGDIVYVGPVDDVATNRPLLTVNLIEWRTNPLGMVDCTFSASLSSPKGKKALGVFSGTALMTFAWRNWFDLADQFDDAAGDAASDLFSRINQTNLLG